MEQTIGYGMVAFLGIAVIFYSLGYGAGKRNGHRAGRSVGIRIGERRAIERQVQQ